MKIGEIKPITLIRFFREATKERQHTHKRISNARSVLNGIMSYAIEEEIISHNPVSDVNFKQFTYKPVEVQSDNVFSREDTHKLLHYLKMCIRDRVKVGVKTSSPLISNEELEQKGQVPVMFEGLHTWASLYNGRLSVKACLLYTSTYPFPHCTDFKHSLPPISLVRADETGFNRQ